MIFKNKQGKMVGELKSGIFHKKVSKEKHLYRTTDSWGIDRDVLKSLPDGTNIIIQDTDKGGILYYASKELFRQKGVKKEFGIHGAQVFLERRHFGTQELFQKQIDWFDSLGEEEARQVGLEQVKKRPRILAKTTHD